MAETLVAWDDFDGAWSFDRVYATSGARWNTSTGRLGCSGTGAGVSNSFPIADGTTYFQATPSLPAGAPDHGIEVKGLTASVGVYVRGLGGNVVTNSYLVTGSSGGILLFRGTGSKLTNGQYVQVGTSMGTYSAGDTLKVTAVGATLTIYKNGVQVNTQTINASTNTEVGLQAATAASAVGSEMFQNLKVFTYASGEVALTGVATGRAAVLAGRALPLDSNRTGVFWCLGNDGASNPQTTGAIALSASGLYSPSWPLTQLVDRDANAGGPATTTNVANSWFAVDLKDAHLSANWISMRQRTDNSMHMAVSVVFEGSADGVTWTTITTVTMTATSGVWTDATFPATDPWQFFRIRHPGQTSTFGYYYFCLAEWEIGGVLRRLPLEVRGGDLSAAANGVAGATGLLGGSKPIAGVSAGSGSVSAATVFTGQPVAVAGVASSAGLGTPMMFRSTRVAEMFDDGRNSLGTRPMTLVTGDPQIVARAVKLHSTYDGRPAGG